MSIRYTERLAEAGVVGSVGSRGDSYDNALAESFNGLYKAELIHRRGPWKGVEDVEWSTLTYVDPFNNRRLHTQIGMVPPAEFEANYYRHTARRGDRDAAGRLVGTAHRRRPAAHRGADAAGGSEEAGAVHFHGLTGRPGGGTELREDR